MEQITLNNVIHALNDARNEDYSLIEKYFLSDYETTINNIVDISFLNQKILNIQTDTEEGCFLENLAKYGLRNHPNQKEAKEYLARKLSNIKPKNISGNLEYFVEGIVYVLLSLCLLEETKTINGADRIGYKLFGQFREKKYRKTLGLSY